MKKENIAAIVLVIIVLVSLSAFLIIEKTDLLKQKPKVGEISFGDCVNLSYIGRYASNGTVFSSSYTDIKNKTEGKPLLIYVTLNETASPPNGYANYTQSNIPKGLIEGIVGLKEGETKTLTIPPEKAYGVEKYIKIGDSFNSTHLTASLYNNTLNQTFEVIGLDDGNITLKWLNVQDHGNFTLPEYIITENFSQVYYTGMLYDTLPPYYLWANSSKIINVTNANILIKTTPTKTKNLTDQVTPFGIADKIGFIFPDVTTAEWNENKIYINSSPVPGTKYVWQYMEMVLNISIGNVTETNINVTVEYQGQSQPYELNRSIEFNRTYPIRRIYVIPLAFTQYTIDSDVKYAGFSLNKLSGKQLIYDVTVEKVYNLN